MDWGAILIAALSGGAVVALFQHLTRKSELEADADALGITVLRDQVGVMRADLKDAKLRIKELECAQVANQKDLIAAQKESAEKEIVIKKLESENGDLLARINERDSRITKLEQQIASLTLEVEEMKARLGTKGC